MLHLKLQNSYANGPKGQYLKTNMLHEIKLKDYKCVILP
jgi:hypothetical protein